MTYHGEDHTDTSHSLCKQAIAFFLSVTLLAGLPQRNTNDVPSSDPLKFYSTWSCILSGVSSGILCRYLLVVYLANLLFGILSCIFSGTLSAILSGISSSILSGIYFGVLSVIYSGILCGILSRIYFGILCGIYSGSLSVTYSGSFLAYILAFHLAAEVQRCPLSSEGPRLRSSGAHWARKVPSWRPALPTALRTLQLRSAVAHCARKLVKSEELARRKWTWKWRQRWWRWRRRTRRRTRRRWNSCDKI